MSNPVCDKCGATETEKCFTSFDTGGHSQCLCYNCSINSPEISHVDTGAPTKGSQCEMCKTDNVRLAMLSVMNEDSYRYDPEGWVPSPVMIFVCEKCIDMIKAKFDE